MRRIELRDNKMTYRPTARHKFAYDVSGISSYVEDQKKDLIADLVFASPFLDRVTVMEGVKGTEQIKLLNSSPALQDASGCGRTPSGGVIFSEETISTSRLKIEEIYCNETLNGEWTQLYNKAGANQQDEEQPDFADVMIAYYIKKAMRLNQDAMFNGDTDSLNSDLAHYDGWIKRWENDGDINLVGTSETSITSTNAYDLAIKLYEAIPAELHDNPDVNTEIIVGRETYRKIINAVYADNNFHYTIEEEEGPEPSFVLPTTNMRVRVISQLNGTEKMFAVPYEYMIYGTDLTSDIDGMEFKYSTYKDELYFGTKWRSGVSYVLPQYFSRLKLTPTS